MNRFETNYEQVINNSRKSYEKDITLLLLNVEVFKILPALLKTGYFTSSGAVDLKLRSVSSFPGYFTSRSSLAACLHLSIASFAALLGPDAGRFALNFF